MSSTTSENERHDTSRHAVGRSVVDCSPEPWPRSALRPGKAAARSARSRVMRANAASPSGSSRYTSVSAAAWPSRERLPESLTCATSGTEAARRASAASCCWSAVRKGGRRGSWSGREAGRERVLHDRKPRVPSVAARNCLSGLTSVLYASSPTRAGPERNDAEREPARRPATDGESEALPARCPVAGAVLGARRPEGAPAEDREQCGEQRERCEEHDGDADRVDGPERPQDAECGGQHRDERCDHGYAARDHRRRRVGERGPERGGRVAAGGVR